MGECGELKHLFLFDKIKEALNSLKKVMYKKEGFENANVAIAKESEKEIKHVKEFFSQREDENNRPETFLSLEFGEKMREVLMNMEK